jgi:adenylate cyclase class 2
MGGNREVEIKFRVEDTQALTKRLETLGFHQVTGRTHEMNTLYDLAGERLRRRGALLRIRKYGEKWTVTYKDRHGVGPGRHKVRREIETSIANGQTLAKILEVLGFRAGFAYEKFRSEWTDSPSSPPRQPGHESLSGATGHVVIDETPIGNFGEIEGPPDWIDSVAGRLGISRDDYITASYGELFLQWRKKTGSKVNQMMFPL